MIGDSERGSVLMPPEPEAPTNTPQVKRILNLLLARPRLALAVLKGLRRYHYAGPWQESKSTTHTWERKNVGGTTTPYPGWIDGGDLGKGPFKWRARPDDAYGQPATTGKADTLQDAQEQADQALLQGQTQWVLL